MADGKTWLRWCKRVGLAVIVVLASMTALRWAETAGQVLWWKARGLPVPPASADYTIVVSNASDTDLRVGALLLNELRDPASQSPRGMYLDAYHGRSLYREWSIPRGNTEPMRIPLEHIPPRLSRLLITAKGPEGYYEHEFAWYVVSWKALQKRGPRGITLTIHDSDLVTLTAEDEPGKALTCPQAWPDDRHADGKPEDAGSALKS